VGLALVLVAACGLALWLSPRDPQPPARWRPERIILFTVDTLRADELGLYGFDELDVSPHLDRWAQDAIVFDRASSQAPWTVPSLAAFLTGRFGSEMGVYTNETGIPQGWATLAETLRDAGYRTAAFNSHSLLLEDEMGFRRGFDEVFPRASAPILEGEHKMPFAAVEPDLDRWLDEHSTDHFFIWIHDMDPHSPKTPGNPYLANSDWHRYDAEVRWVDDTFGRILARLQSAGVWDDDFLFVFTADHGEAFGDHGLLGHQNVMYDEVLRVPLLIQYSAMKGPMRISDPVDLFDVRRTILDLAGVPDPTGRQGESLLPLMEGIRKERGRRFSVHSRHYFEDGHHEYAIRDRVWKLIVRTPPSEDRLGEGVPTWLVGREGTRVELYNLVVDPGEGEDVAATHPEIVEYLLNALDDWDKSLSKPERRAPRLDEEDLEILERLGYNPSSDS
jgi:arylsulfatase A-like enzyme